MTDDHDSDIYVEFLDGFFLGTGIYTFPDGKTFLGMVLEKPSAESPDRHDNIRYFIPFWENPSDLQREEFTKALREFDELWSNIGLRDDG